MSAITVGICTFRRASLADTIRSIDAQSPLSAGRILIVDNDDTPSARPLIEDIKGSLRTNIEYHHIPGRNIAVARNTILELTDTEQLAFIDDDEIAHPDWLSQLNAALKDDWAAVMGPMFATYPDTAPDWLKHLSPHSQLPVTKNDEAINGHTANCLIDLSHPAFKDLRFDPSFGRRGGSDSLFFQAARARGARFAHAPNAIVTEPVSPERQSLDWLLRRRWRIGQTLGRTSKEAQALLITKSAAKAAYCAGDALLNLPFASRRYRALLRASMHLGKAAGAMRVPMRDWYGGEKAA